MAQSPTEHDRGVLDADLQPPPFDAAAATVTARRLFRTSSEGAPRTTSRPPAV